MYLVFVLLCCTQSKCVPGVAPAANTLFSFPWTEKYHFLRLHRGFERMSNAHLHLLKSGFSAASLQRQVSASSAGGAFPCSQRASWLLTPAQGCQDHLENTSRRHFHGFLMPPFS